MSGRCSRRCSLPPSRVVAREEWSFSASSMASSKTLMGGVRGFDGGKKLVGRKRHILVDTLDFLLAAVVHPAHLPDRQGEVGRRSAAGGVSAFAAHLG